jgi:hypothetical protein
MAHRRAAGEKVGKKERLRKPRVGNHGACLGLLALRTLIVCGALAGSAIGAIIAITDKGESGEPAITAPGHVGIHAVPVAQTITLRTRPAAAPVQQTLDEDFSVDEAAVTWARRIPDDVLERDLANVGDGNEMLHFGPVQIRRRLVETIVRAARQTGADPALLMAIADKESSFSTGIRAQTSSATGLFQFIDTTWFRVVREFGAQHGLAKEAAEIEGPDDKPIVADPRERAHILSLRDDPYLSALLAAEMLNHDGGEIARSLGRDLTGGETYLTHFLGPQDATRFMEEVVDQPKLTAAKLLPKPAQANRPIFFARGRAKPLSVAAVHDEFEAMMGPRVGRYARVGEMAGASAYAE